MGDTERMGENADIVRRLYDAFNRGDTAAAYELIDPEIEYVNPEDAVEPGTRHGLRDYDQAMGKIREVFGAARIETEQLVESGDRVAAVVSFEFHARGSGLEAATRQGHVWTIRNGKAVRFEWSSDPDRALAVRDTSS